LVIGQTQGDIRILHDPAISDPHVEIAWRNRVLVVRDLQSQSGTFFRVGRSPLSAGQEMRIGSRCYHFREPGVLAMQTAAGVTRLTLVGNEVWMGRDPGPRGFRVSGDPAVDRRHARFVRDAAGQWAIHDNHSLNGVWLRREEGQVDAVAEFFAGEQRFRLELPHPGP
jgi:pSer/pThr/pTyr-binding forkhead associated (FHA) protein